MNIENENSPTSSNKLLLIGFSSDEEQSIQLALNTQAFFPVSHHSIKTALQQLFYDDYAVALFNHARLDESDLYLLHEASVLAPWRGILLVGEKHLACAPETTRGFCLYLARHELHKLPEILRNVEAAREKWVLPLSAFDITRFHKLFYHMRMLSLTALKEQEIARSMDLIFSLLAKHVSLNYVGFVDLNETAPFFLLEISDEDPAKRVEQLTGTILRHIRRMSPKVPALTPLIHASRQMAPCDPDSTPCSLFPIIIENHQRAWLILSLSDATYPAQLYFSLIVHMIHYMASIFAAMQHLRVLAFQDSLTGLYNRRYMEDACRRMFLLGQRYGHTVAILFIDVDHFKIINDRLGHDVGDRVLMRVASILTQSLRQSDIIARYGGDEFLVVLPHTSALEAVNTANRICKDAQQTITGGEEEQSITVSVSIGVALSSAETRDFNETIHHADEALLKAKTTGGNQVLQWNAIEMEENLAVAREAGIIGLPPQPSDASVKAGILLVDDDALILQYLDRLLRQQQYRTFAALSAVEAEKILDANPTGIALLITDINLPDMNGFELLQSATRKDPSMVKLVISSDVSAERAILAMRHGAYDIIQKPFTNDQLTMSVSRALEYHRVLQENRGFQQKLIEIVNLKSSENRRSLEQVKEAYQCTLDTMVAMLDAREQYTSQHSIRVRELTIHLARQMGFKPSAVKEIGQGALLHDIGKIGIADSILLKPDSLTVEERHIMELHPQIGHSFLRSNDVLKYAAELVLSHHERWDGTGYPRKLKGEEILMGARIFSVIDCYDAIRSKRVYKPSIPAREALVMIQQESGRLYDPAVVNVFTAQHGVIEKMGRWDIINQQ